jgi:hypothetical protein
MTKAYRFVLVKPQKNCGLNFRIMRDTVRPLEISLPRIQDLGYSHAYYACEITKRSPVRVPSLSDGKPRDNASSRGALEAVFLMSRSRLGLEVSWSCWAKTVRGSESLTFVFIILSHQFYPDRLVLNSPDCLCMIRLIVSTFRNKMFGSDEMISNY